MGYPQRMITMLSWTIQVDPLTAALGFAHVQVERALAPHFSVYAGPHMRLYDSILSDDVEPYRGYGVEAGARWFWAGRAPAGGWLSARGVGATLRTTDGSDLRGPGGYGSMLCGYTGIIKDRWVLSGGAGAQYIAYQIGGYGPRGVFPALHTAVGVAF
jgi:hypothetical protein